MTTGNKIVTKTIDNVVFIPLECVQTGEDSIPVVYLKNRTKHIVVLSESNENNVIVDKGVESGDVLYLSTPPNPEKFRLIGEELKSVIIEREKAKKEEEIRIRKEAEKALEERSQMMQITPEMMKQFQNGRGDNQQGGRQRGDNSQVGGQRSGNNQFGQQGGQQGGTVDTAAMRRRMMNMQNGQQRNNRDTTRRRQNN
jgi:hypothetical protein